MLYLYVYPLRQSTPRFCFQSSSGLIILFRADRETIDAIVYSVSRITYRTKEIYQGRVVYGNALELCLGQFFYYKISLQTLGHSMWRAHLLNTAVSKL